MFHLIPYLHKKPDNIIIHFGTNDGPYSDENAIYVEINKIKELIKTHYPDCKKRFISSPISRLDNKKAAIVVKNYINILEREERNVILHDNINESHLYHDDLHLNVTGAS